MGLFTKCVLLVLSASYVLADIYMQMPRGSNNRLDEANRDRANANRLFDSQNNNRGGYNVGSTYYTQGSTIYMSWTNQHSCGAGSNACELVIQYMCDDNLRDGTTTQRIPDNNNNCYKDDCDNDLEYGRHESYQWYKNCTMRSRNYGLFTSNQNLNGNSAQYTRQNTNGNRHGYECPEERDYYPYWYPTPWVDVAILTNQPTRCEEYKANSENVKGRWYCDPPEQLYEYNLERNVKGWIPLNKTQCEALNYIDESTQTTYWGEWKRAPSHGVAAPSCTQNRWSRDNHLGDGMGGYNNMFNFTAPTDFTHENCVFRLRYNITTYDFDVWESATSVESGEIDAGNNSDVANANVYPARVDVWSEYGLSYDDVSASFDPSTNNNEAALKASREYVLKNDPYVDVLGSLLTGNNAGEAKLQLNINTNQFGRTFEDRSHRWILRPNTADCEGLVTHNLQVRGKRGNIVQTYPGTEYDFVPEHLNMAEGECIHIQWTGSDTNPNNNAGQGRAGTDRHNIVQSHGAVYTETTQRTSPKSYGQWGTSFPAHMKDTEANFLGLSNKQVQALAVLDTCNPGGNNKELDEAGPYCDPLGGPVKITSKGIWHYLSTRSNNFSNRSHKGKITVTDTAAAYASVGWEGGTVQALGGASVNIPAGALNSATQVSILTTPVTASTSNTKSDFVEVHVEDRTSVFEIEIPYSRALSIFKPKVIYSNDHTSRDIKDGSWSRQRKVRYRSGYAIFEAETSGVYVVARGFFSLWFCIFLIILIAGGVFGLMYMNDPELMTKLKAHGPSGKYGPTVAKPTFVVGGEKA